MPKIYAYMRYSQSKQSRDSISIQRDIITGYASANSIHIDREFIDEGVSGYSGSQENEGTAYSDLMSTVQSGDTICVSVMSRFSRRDPVTSAKNLLNLLQQGINIILCEERRKLTQDSDTSDLVMTLLHQGTAAKESADKSLYAKKGHEKRLNRISAGEFAIVHTPTQLSDFKEIAVSLFCRHSYSTKSNKNAIHTLIAF